MATFNSCIKNGCVELHVTVDQMHTDSLLLQVKINPVVNFEWEAKHYIGQLVAVHRNGLHVAYVLRGRSTHF